MALGSKQQRFVDEYMIDFNAKQAAIRAGYSPKTAEQQGSRLLSNAKVQEAVKQAQADLAKRTEITADKVLQRWWAIANADPNELIQYRRLACRYCHGANHSYQWESTEEYEKECAAADDFAKKESVRLDKEVSPRYPSDAGGYGFDRLADPHPDCPECRGEGRSDIHIADTRKLTGPARLLYAGIKTTQSGIEIKMNDQMKALENVARHLGMFNDKVELTGKDGTPLQIVFDAGMGGADDG